MTVDLKRPCALLVVPLLFATVGCDGLDQPTLGTSTLPAKAASSEPPRSFDDHLMRIAEQVPGFAGVYLDADGEVVIRYADPKAVRGAAAQLPPAAKARLRDALLAAFDDGNDPLQRIQSALRRGNAKSTAAPYSFDQIHAWRTAFVREAGGELNALGVVYLDSDERNGRVAIAIEPGASASTIRSRAEQIGIAPDALRIFETAPLVPYVAQATPDTVTTYVPPCDVPDCDEPDDPSPPTSPTPAVLERHRPLKLGTAIRNTQTGYCTLGFLYRGEADNLTGPGLWTNDHCSNARGAVDNVEYLQPGVTRYRASVTNTADLVASETYASQETVSTICPSGYSRCFMSDVSMSTLYNSSHFPTDFGGNTRIAIVKPTAMWSPDAPRATTDFEVTSFSIDAPFSGQQLDKVGATTGWTTGSVSDTCVDIPISGHLELCAYRVNRPAGQSARIADFGDSGSPVFTRLSSGDVEHRGMLFAGPGSGPKSYYFFNIHYIIRTTWERGIPEYYW